MKVLTLVCNCGKTKSFRGEDSASILKAIDAQQTPDNRGKVRDGWCDMPSDKTLPCGQMAALCPDCEDA